jgi:hypothetical protein
MEIKTEFQIYFQRRRKLYINFPIHDCKIFKAINPSDAQPDAGKLNMVTYGYGSGGCT